MMPQETRCFQLDFVKMTNDEKIIRLGLNIALYRKMKGITQAELAEKVNISRTHMGNIEAPNMVKPISLELAFDIADALEISNIALYLANF